MADGPEAKIGKAAYKLIAEWPGVADDYAPIILTEGLTERYSYQQGSLVIGAFPVAPKERPTESKDIFVDVYICPVLAIPSTEVNCEMETANELNRFRMIVQKKGNRQLKDPSDPDRPITDANPDFSWLRTFVPPDAPNLRIPRFVARYKSMINVNDGSFP